MKFYQSKKKKQTITICFLFRVIKFSCKLYYIVSVALFFCTSVCWDFIINCRWGHASSLVDTTDTFFYALSTISQALCTIFVYVILFKQICTYRWITERWINLPKVSHRNQQSQHWKSDLSKSQVLLSFPHYTTLLLHFYQQAAVSQRCSRVIIPNFHQFLMSF